ncbi:LOW QUALITY PROTEIN: uncharacterized protein LOC103864194 [Brassica rapa]|uniref:LOW QUALITY PROTEIN: uncharacterized protein LOC103864194 n=1 Tax=Brassica campestris TaxID=3711 RepID=UPI00142D2562|nr:LOW QUALITY PROTEIN: uncharacterized protein LOC103864194 [Brassica rapa]
MAKNFNSVSFTILVLVLMMASTGILKTKALPGVECPVGSGCLLPSTRVFSQECGPAPFTVFFLFCFQIKHQGQNLSLLAPKCDLMLCALLFHSEYIYIT